ncbi:MAG: SDR family oxidoreductase [Thermosipho sp. (in: Bacteria)]|nr:SDR family oxidoreductase [Thermosipho sp. (in: thermotogales)]
MPEFNQGEWVLITGGSSGIGEEFAYQLAKKNVNLILVGRDKERLVNVYKNIKQKNYSIDVKTIKFDLSSDIDIFIDTINHFEIDHLINNAGFGWYGEFINVEHKIYEKMISLNITNLTTLSHYLSKKLVEKKKGGIINVSSVAAFFPLPRFSVYSATKTYVHNFSIALYAELKKYNVHVMCLAPGKTKTRFFERANMENKGKYMSVEKVVKGAIKAYEKDKPLYIPGLSNKLAYYLIKKLFSDTVIANYLEKYF